MTSRQIRQQFLDFFASKGHAHVPSSPVVPHDDPTLMFTNAGMNQFKPIFLGTESPKHLRVANSQKCIRAGGKHNDLDDVGQDTYHHTFFEMLGNWSFGDYFKKEAIEWAWELLTKVWGIDKTRLHATYFRGDPAEGLEPDSEAAQLWRTATDIDPTHIHPGNKKDNFWEMGDTGPCGPCSEIHIDLTPDRSGGPLVNKGDARVIEIWNLVFIQFNRGSDGKLTPLPAKHVDTGMGFERLCAVLQKKTSNYDTDVFTPIFEAIRKRTGAPAYRGTLPEPRASARAETKTQSEAASPRGLKSAARQDSAIDNRQSAIMVDVSYRVIADHLRCLVFALTDGAIPSNEGRGYVLRRILRRAVRYGRQYLNMHEPFLCDLVPTVVEHMGDVFPELRIGPDPKRPRDNVKHVADIIRDEETSFLKTLDRGIELFRDFAAMTRAVAGNQAARDYLSRKSGAWDRPDYIQPFKTAGNLVFPGRAVFVLYDTHGFPPDLTKLMAEEEGLSVDMPGFEKEMVDARERARAGSRPSDASTFLERPIHATTIDLKYWSDHCPTRIIGYAISGTFFEKGAIPPSVELALVTHDSCFYPEQGGQIGDSGIVTKQSEEVFRVVDTKQYGNAVLHIGTISSPEILLNVGDFVWMQIDDRTSIMRNHTCTHILNWALRQVLELEGHGKVDQKGSLVDRERTRFDFSHTRQLTEEELSKIEHQVRSKILTPLDVHTKEADQKDARQINTLRAVFGEKYPDMVRVVSIGPTLNDLLSDPKNPKWMQYSVEFCGGTHLKNSKEAEEFVLVHEEAVAKGVRRLVGLTAEKAREAIRRGQEFLEIAEALRTRRTPPLPPLTKGGSEGGVYDLARLLRELSETTIPILTRHQLAGQIAVLQESAKEHQKQASAQAQRGAVESVGELLASKAIDVGGVTVVVGEVPGGNADALRSGIDYVRNKKGSSAVLLATSEDGKVTLVAGMSKDLVERGIKAGDLIKEICPLVGGKGGGRPDMAQGGGADPKGLPKALKRAREWLADKLSA